MKPTVLIVEDNTESRYLFSYVLTREGYTVLQAVNGVEALKLVESQSPALIILDIQMPELDGYETIARLRKNPRFATTPIIGLSAYAMASDRERAFSVGFTHYIEKPIEIDRFLDEVSPYLPKSCPN